jgi:formylglycine-generating enzyme required for sulfatase activity
MKSKQGFYLSMALIFCALFFMQLRPFRKEMKLLPKEIRASWCYIPGGKVAIESDTALVTSFYMAKNEVSNAEYLSFLEAQNRNANFDSKWLIDTNQWNLLYPNTQPYQPYAKYYAQHPAYRNYPAVCVSYEGAMAYCNWLASEIQKQLGTGFNVSCALPSREEWIRAARGDHHRFVYSWGGPYLTNAKGYVQCNYAGTGDETISIPMGQKKVELHPEMAVMGVAGHVHDNADILAPCGSYAPSPLGCYNACGNAAEILRDGRTCAGGCWGNTGYDVRVESIMEFTGPSPYVGFRPLIEIGEVDN